MRAICSIGVLVTVAAPAHAGHHRCRESSDVVGYHECSTLGGGWSGITLAWQLGVATQWFRLDAIDRDVDIMRDGRLDHYHVDAAGAPTTATAVVQREVYNFTEHFHVASELAFGGFSDARPLAITPVARDAMPSAGATRGYLFDGLLAIGAHGSLARLTLGTELGFGVRMMVSERAELPGTWFGQGGPVLEARAHALLWLSPHWSVDTLVGRNVLASGEYSLAFAFGLHAFPFDGGR